MVDQNTNGQILKTSSRALHFRIWGGALLLLLGCLVATIFFAIFGFGTDAGKLLILTMWVLAILFIAIGSAMAYRRYERSTYVLGEDSLIINRASLFSVRSEMYRYDSIVSVEVSKSFLGFKADYGNIAITIPRLTTRVILNNVLDPYKTAELIKQKVSLSQPSQFV